MSLDEQRSRICVAGVVFLAASLILSSLGHPPPDAAWGAFVTMVVGPLFTGTSQKYREAVKGLDKDRDQ